MTFIAKISRNIQIDFHRSLTRDSILCRISGAIACFFTFQIVTKVQEELV